MTPSSSSSMRTVNIGMVGAGTVGGGVYELIMGRLHSSQQLKMIISKICVRDLEKERSFSVDDEYTTLTTDVNDLLNDPSINMIVEVMGGTGLAKDIVTRAIQSNKHVVTANKALIAENMVDLEKLLAKHTEAGFGYEAAVCGGIPIIRTLQQSYCGDVIHSIQGICNGTTNYMLCKLQDQQALASVGSDDDVVDEEDDGSSAANTSSVYQAVLKEAQNLGYAEADPTADVEGYDVRAKIAIMAKLAFGITIKDLEEIPCLGISQLTDVDFEYANLLGCSIKLLGTAQRSNVAREFDGPLSVYVSPCMVPKSHILASISSNGNGVAVTSANMGECSYLGPGAGRFPTANSVVADICRLAQCANGSTAPAAFPKLPSSGPLALDYDFVSSFYIRLPFSDQVGIIKSIGELASDHDVSIHSILQNPIRDRASADVCITTEECKYSQVQAYCAELNAESFCREECMCMPLLMT